MKIQLLDTKSNEKVAAHIRPAIFSDMPLKKDGWKFNWRELFRTKEAMIYKLTLEDDFNSIEGVILMKLLNGETLEMKNIELAPHNIGKNKRYDFVAGCLIAFACYQSFSKAKNGYEGCLTFESKTKLIPLYEKKYGAFRGLGQRMFIEVEASHELIERYLKI